MSNMKSNDETIQVLNQFNKEFDASKKDLIDKFLQDQKELNKRFKEYALETDDESVETASTLNKAGAKQYGLLGRKVSSKAAHTDDDDCSVDSNLTEYSNSDSEEDRKPMPCSANARRHRVKPAEQSAQRVNNAASGLLRSQSLRTGGKVERGLNFHTPRPPGALDVSLGGNKPSLGELQLPSADAAERTPSRSRPQQRKLLVKRPERPKSALGYQTQASSTNADENNFPVPNRIAKELRQNKVLDLASEACRSAPSYRPAKHSWNTDPRDRFTHDNAALGILPSAIDPGRRHALVPPVRLNPPDNDPRNAQYTSQDKHGSFLRSKAIRQTLPMHKPDFDQGNQPSSLSNGTRCYAPSRPTSSKMLMKETISKSRELGSVGSQQNATDIRNHAPQRHQQQTGDPWSHAGDLRTHTPQQHVVDPHGNAPQRQTHLRSHAHQQHVEVAPTAGSQMRRFKGQDNLSLTDKGGAKLSRFSKIKLPPVSKKTKYFKETEGHAVSTLRSPEVNI